MFNKRDYKKTKKKPSSGRNQRKWRQYTRVPLFSVFDRDFVLGFLRVMKTRENMKKWRWKNRIVTYIVCLQQKSRNKETVLRGIVLSWWSEKRGGNIWGFHKNFRRSSREKFSVFFYNRDCKRPIDLVMLSCTTQDKKGVAFWGNLFPDSDVQFGERSVNVVVLNDTSLLTASFWLQAILVVFCCCVRTVVFSIQVEQTFFLISSFFLSTLVYTWSSLLWNVMSIA